MLGERQTGPRVVYRRATTRKARRMLPRLTLANPLPPKL